MIKKLILLFFRFVCFKVFDLVECQYRIDMAEREGFEPSIRFRIHTFQACAFNHSATSPKSPRIAGWGKKSSHTA